MNSRIHSFLVYFGADHGYSHKLRGELSNFFEKVVNSPCYSLRIAISYDDTTGLTVERLNQRFKSFLASLNRKEGYSIPELQAYFLWIQYHFLVKRFNSDGNGEGLAKDPAVISHQQGSLAHSSLSNHDDFEVGPWFGAVGSRRTPHHLIAIILKHYKPNQKIEQK